MSIYAKPVRFLMKEMADELALPPGKTFTRQQAIDWFARQYPKIKTGTIQCHLIRLSTNARTRLHYNAKSGEGDVLFQLEGGHFRLFDPAQDPLPIHKPTDGNVLREEEDTESTGSAEFAYEADLRNYLSKNLTIIEPGLKLYQDQDEGITGVEFPVGGRFIDILAIDSKDGFVVIELKVSRGYDRVVGQLMRYMAWIRTNQAETNQQVRGVIVAREISKDLLLACSLLPGVLLFEYELSLKLNPIRIAGCT